MSNRYEVTRDFMHTNANNFKYCQKYEIWAKVVLSSIKN